LIAEREGVLVIMADTANLHPAGEPDYAVAPGETIREFLDDLGMTQRELSTRLGLSPKHVNQLVQGLVPLSADVASRLELVTGMPTRMWLRLEADYEATRQRLGQRIDMAESTAWLQELPIGDLVKRGVLPPKPSDTVSRTQQALAFFGVAHISTYRELYEKPAVAFRQTKAFKADPGAVAAWLRLGELMARDVRCEPFDRRGLEDSLAELRQLTVQPPQVFLVLMRDICARHGVAVVVVAEIKGARASGATKWLSPEKAMILLSDRYKRDDHMWFTFFHEICHVLKHGKAEVWIEDERSVEDPREDEADRFARDLLIPPNEAERMTELSTLGSIVEFAREIGIVPSIVVGRMQHEGLLEYRIGNKLRHKVDFDVLQTVP
jgi:HTH-type transcriptional regulator/antitoxin HigA